MGKTAALLPTWPNATCDWMEMTEGWLNALWFLRGNKQHARKTGARLSRRVVIRRFASHHRISPGRRTRLGSGCNVSLEMGAMMQARWLRGGRGVQLAVSVVVCAALWGSSARAFTEDDQRRLCTGDVFRLCSSEIPDRERIIVCMRHKRAQLSDGCRSVFGKPAQAASASSGYRW